MATGKRELTRDELETFLQEAAAVVNSTPLWTVSEDPADPQPLSPAHLLTLREEPHLTPPEEYDEKDALAYGPRRWRRAQLLADHFWARWKSGYLQELQERRKWVTPTPQLQEGALVLVKDKAAKRMDWAVARVEQVHPSSDQVVRKATITTLKKTATGSKKKSYLRPAQDLVLLFSPQ